MFSIAYLRKKRYNVRVKIQMKKKGGVFGHKSKYEKMEELNVTNEKIIGKVDKILKQIDPNSKKSITQLSENEKFKASVEEIKQYVENYVEKDNFPVEVYDKIQSLISFCDNEYKELTEKKIKLQKQARVNVALAGVLNEVYLFAITREDFSEYEKTLKENDLGDYIDKLRLISQSDRKSDEYAQAEKTVKSKINNLEANMHIEIDLERIDDKEKVLSYISIELDNVLTKVSVIKEITVEIEEEAVETATEEVYNPADVYIEDLAKYKEYQEGVVIQVKETLWQRIANSRFVRSIKEFFGVTDVPKLAAGTTELKAE